jgi:hypothetical protein
MKLETENNGRNIWKHIWYPKQKDVIGFRVFQMISIPVIMVLSIVVNIYTRNATWNFLMMAWLLVAILLWVVASIRFKKINAIKNE